MNVQELPLSLPSTTGTPFPAPRGPRLRNEGALYAPEDLTAPPQPPPLLSPEEEARARGERTYNQVTDWNDMLSGEDGFRKVAERRGFLRDYLDAAGGAAGGEELRGRLTRNVFIQDLTGASPEQLVGGVPQLQLAGVMGLPDGDDATFDAKMKELVGREMNYRRNWEKVYQIGNRAALRGTPWADAKKEAEALAGTDWKLFQPLFDKGFTDVYSQFSQEDLELIDHGWRTVSMLDWREYQEEPDPETFNKAFERYGRMTQAERMKILGGIQLRAASEGEDLAKLPERFGQAMLYRGTALITRLNSAQGREAADGLLELAHSSGKVLLNTPVITEKYLRDNGGSITTEDASDVGRLELSADVHEFSTAEQLRSGVRVTGTKYRNLGEDEKEAITRYAYWLRGISAFMLGIQHHNIQAARFRDNEFTGNRGTFLDLLVAAGESIPAMGATAIPYGVGLPLTLTSYAEDELYRLQAENPAADPEVLERAAYANGALKVGLDRLELGILRARMPRFSAFAMNRGKLIGVPMVAGGRLLANGAFQTVQEVAQDAMDPLVQAATAAIAEDVRMPDLGKWMEREKQALGEIAGVSFLLSFAGAAGTTAVDYIQAPALRASLMDASELRLAGIPEVEAARISAMAESHPAAAAQLLHATMRDTPAAARREISRAEAERLELGWLNAGMREAGLPEILRDGEGGVFVRYHDDATADRAFPTLEDAAREVDSHLQGRDVDLTRLNRQLFDLLSRSYGSLGDLELDGTVKPGRISLADIVSRDPAMLETARQRARIHFRQAEADMGLAHATDGTIDSHLASLFVLGSSRNEFAGGVTRIVAEIAGNASPLTVLEESIEGVGKYLMERRGVSRGKMLRWIRETEAGTRTQILAGDFDTLDEARQYQELIEGWSRIGVAHATGRMRDSQLAGPLRSFFRALREVLGQVLRLAAAMRHHAASGKMDAEMRHWLDVAAGFTPADGSTHANTAQKNGNSILDAEGNIPISASFSISPQEAIGIRKKIEAQQPADLSTEGIPTDLKAKAAVEWLKSQNTTGTTHHPAIGDIEIRNRGIKNALGHLLHPRKAAALLKMKELIPGATVMQFREREGTSDSYRLARRVTIDGTDYVARIVIDTDSNGNRYYNHELSDLTELRKSKDPQPLIPGVDPKGQQIGVEEIEDSGKLLQWIYSVKEADLQGTSSAPSGKAGFNPTLPDPKKLGGLLDDGNEVSFSIGNDSLSADSEQQITAATKAARAKVQQSDAASIRRAGGFWLSLHGVEGVSQLPELNGKDMRTLVDEAKKTFPDLKFFHWQDGDIDVTQLNDRVGQAEINVQNGKVWVDTTRAGGQGSSSPKKWETRVKASMAPAVYQIAQAYAKNNGLRFIPDPFGVSAIATFRRWPQLLSSAIRMGDTTHIDGTQDVEGWKDGDHKHNAGLLAMHEYEYVRHFFPEIDGLRLSDDSATIVDHAGTPVSDQTLRDLLVGGRHPSRLGIGETTLRRAVVTGQTAAERGMEPQPEAEGRLHGERRIHPGAVKDFAPDSGSGVQGTSRLKHALSEISYSIGSEPDSPNQPHQHDHGQESGMVPGDGTEQEVPGGSEAEIGRRIREALSRAEEDDVQGRVGSGSESIVHFFGESEVLKDTQSSGLIRLSQDGEYLYDRSFDAAEEKARVINALGGMRTRAISWKGRIMIIQERGTPITETEYLSIELPFGIEPTRHGIHKIRIDGEDYLISDLKPENFVKDSQGNIRLIDLITGKVAKGSMPK